LKRPDLRLINPQYGGMCSHDIALDVSITFPGTDAKIKNQHTDTKHGAAAKLAENDKRNKYVKYCDANGLHFVPLIFETYGVWGEEMKSFFKKTSKLGWEKRGKTIKQSVWSDSWKKKYSVCLQIANAKLIISRTLSATGGNSFHKEARLVDSIRNSEVRVNYSENSRD
jgi:hypothetical protein